jgi:hypothetical protein
MHAAEMYGGGREHVHAAGWDQMHAAGQAMETREQTRAARVTTHGTRRAWARKTRRSEWEGV